MELCRGTVWRLAFLGVCLVALEVVWQGVDAARLAATRAAQKEAAAKLEEAKTKEEILREKEKLQKLKADINELLRDNKEYRQRLLKKKQEEEVAEFGPKDLEESELWRVEYQKFLDAEKSKDRWERAGIVSALGAAVAAGLAGFGKAHENSGGVSQNASAARLIKGAGMAALIGTAGALISWVMRRHSKKRQKLLNARLQRFQFEARTGLEPGEENVLGPDERELFNPKKDKGEEE